MEAGLDDEYNRRSVACSWIGSDEGNEVSGEGYAFGSLFSCSQSIALGAAYRSGPAQALIFMMPTAGGGA